MATFSKTDSDDKSFGHVLRELGSTATELIHSEITLIKSEIKITGDRLVKHGTQLGLAGVLLVSSFIPFLAFLVIALGRWLEDNYWLSSLIVSFVCASISGAIAYRSYKKIKEDDMTLEKARNSLEAGTETIKEKAKDIQNAAKGEYYGQL